MAMQYNVVTTIGIAAIAAAACCYKVDILLVSQYIVLNFLIIKNIIKSINIYSYICTLLITKK